MIELYAAWVDCHSHCADFFLLSRAVFRSEAVAARSPTLQCGVCGPTKAIRRETAGYMVIWPRNDDWLGPYPRPRSFSTCEPQAEAWGYALPPLRGDVGTKSAHLNIMSTPNSCHRSTGRNVLLIDFMITKRQIEDFS